MNAIMKSCFVSVAMLSLAALPVANSSEVKANPQPCHAARRIPGNRCYQRVEVRTRHVGYGDSDEKKAQSTSFQGWYVNGYSQIVDVSESNSSVNMSFTERTTDAEITDIFDTRRRQLLDTRAKLEAQAQFPVEGVPVDIQASLDSVNRELQEIEQRSSSYYAVTTNVDIVTLTAQASGRCVTRVPITGHCLNSVGGWYQGYVDVFMVYVGTPSEINSSSSLVINEAQTVLSLLDNQTPNSNSCFDVSSQEGWQYFNLPGSFNQITTIEGAWSVDASSYSSVGASGHTGEAADRLAPYSQYKFDQNYPFGALLVNIPDVGYRGIMNPQSLSRSISSTAMRINDSDNALGDNEGALRVCFGNE